MKKLLACNLLISLAHFPYVFGRWAEMPYQPPSFILEDVMVFGAMLIGPLLFLNTILLLIFYIKWQSFLKHSLFFNAVLLGLLLIYVIYAGVMISFDGYPVWADAVGAFILFITLRWNHSALEQKS